MNKRDCDKKGLILAATLGDCVHVAGTLNFLRLAEAQGYETHFMGTQRTASEVVEAALETDPEIIAVSFRLSPEVAADLFEELDEALRAAGLGDKRVIFGGTPPVCCLAESSGLFEAVFDGTMDEALEFLSEDYSQGDEVMPPQSLVERIQWRRPYPILRHHFGLPSLSATREGITAIADAKVVDVISIGPDQNAQVAFFRPEEQNPRQDGAGGVPVRSEDDFSALYEASRSGNYPLLRCYSGTRDVLKMAPLLADSIHNAWCAVPLFWYNILDGRGPRSLKTSIEEAKLLMAWHAEQNIPVEVNEAHHWSLRDAPDVIAVVAAYLAARAAKASGVTDYVAQYMFNTPPGITYAMDLAKMLAKKTLIHELEDSAFRIWTQVRTGLLSFPSDLSMAKGQLAASSVLQMALNPDIVHVVSYSEADHAATADDVISSVKIVRQVIKETRFGLPDMGLDTNVQRRTEELLGEARILIDAIEALDPEAEDPLSDTDVLVQAVRLGYLDAPHLAGNPEARGAIQTQIIDGACQAVDPATGHQLSEKDRLAMIEDDALGPSR